MRAGPALLLLLLTTSATLLFSCKERVHFGGEPGDEEEENASFEIKGASEYEFNLLKDPRTGRIPDGVHDLEIEQAKAIYMRQRQMISARGQTANLYTAQGPNNMGGRTRSIAYDVRYDGSLNRTMMAGGVSGGLFKSTDDGATWVRKSPTSAIYSVTSIAQDPRPGMQNTWYYGTGEVLGGNELTAAPMQGDGVYKTTDNGETWKKLGNSNTGSYESFDKREDCIWRIAVNPVNGDIYMAASGAIFRSTDGGDNWSMVIVGSGQSFNALQSTDVMVTHTGKVYAAFDGFNSTDVDGIWSSTTGDPGSWHRIAGSGAGGSPPGWDAENNYGRIVLAAAPSNENLVYAMVRSNSTGCANLQAKLFLWNDLTSSWSNLTANLPGCTSSTGLYLQGGYNMTLAVHPTDPNTVFIGGSTLYRSTDGFTSPNHTTDMTGSDPYNPLHVDVHCLIFNPANPNTMVCGNDGGIQETMDGMADDVRWTSLNHNYATVQYYDVAIDPRAGNNKVIGGAQDNGTTRNTGGTGGSFEMVYGGDGVSVGLSNLDGANTYEYGGYQYGNIFRRNAAWGAGSAVDIRPNDATGVGLFVTLFHLDPDNTDLLYYANDNRLFRNTSASTASPYNWTELTGASAVTATSDDITALATTRGAYNVERSSIFFGNNNGQLYRLENPANTDAASPPVNITGSGFPAFATISSISVNPRNDDTVLVTFSNYGGWVTNIWWTGNAKSASPTWVNVENNLSVPSIRSSAIAVTAAGVQYFVGTSVGLFKTSDPLHSDWMQEGETTIGNAVVSSLALRPSDNRLLVGTYGNAMWSTTISETAAAVLPMTLLDFSGTLQQDRAQLLWHTSNEVNTSRFDLERSDDALNYRIIGSVAAAGNNAGVSEYHFADKDLAQEKTYYRLRMIDLDGQVRLSNIVQLHRQLHGQSVYVTNPFFNSIDIHFGELPQGKVNVSLYDLSGKMLVRKQYSDPGQASIQFNPNIALNSGVYLLEIICDEQRYSLKLVKR